MTKIRNQKSEIRNQRGYIALVALLVVVTTGLTISLAVSIAGIEEIQISHGITQAAKAKSLASACIEDGLERLRSSFSDYSGTLSINGNSCILNIVTSGNSATLSAVGTVDIFNQQIIVQADNSSAVVLDITSWTEN